MKDFDYYLDLVFNRYKKIYGQQAFYRKYRSFENFAFMKTLYAEAKILYEINAFMKGKWWFNYSPTIIRRCYSYKTSMDDFEISWKNMLDYNAYMKNRYKSGRKWKESLDARTV